MGPPRDIATNDLAGHIESLRKRVDRYLSDLVVHDSPRTLYDAVAQVLSSKGKRLRPVLTILTAEAYGVDVETSLPGAAAVEVFHNFTLVHDDIMDESASRRGEATVHVTWGAPAAILAGDFLLGMAYELLSRLPDAAVQPALACFSAMVVRLCEGQALDAEFETSNRVVVEDYLDMVSRKTGALLVASLQLGGIVGKASTEHLGALEEVGYHLGMAFQIQDDLLDLTADSETWGKPIGADLTAGKRTFLLLKAVELEAASGETWFRSLMEKGGLEADRIEEAKERMQRLGVMETTKRVILDEYARALAALETLPRDTSFEGVRWVIERMQTRIQ